MDFLMAVEWVQENRECIKLMISQYRKFSPYEESDYIQEAYEAAMVATLRSESKGIPFEAAFWTIFRNQISVMTPNLNHHGSNSISSHLCSFDIDNVSANDQDGESDLDIEAVFEAIQQHLTKKEQEIFSLSLGLTEAGVLSSYEIAKLLGCLPTNIRNTFSRVFNRLKKLVAEGVVDPARIRHKQFNTRKRSSAGACI